MLWGAWYVPGSVIYAESPFVDSPIDGGDYLLAAVVVTIL